MKKEVQSKFVKKKYKIVLTDRINGHLAAHSRVDIAIDLQVVLAAGSRLLHVERLKLDLQRADVPTVPLNEVVAVEERFIANVR